MHRVRWTELYKVASSAGILVFEEEEQSVLRATINLPRVLETIAIRFFFFRSSRGGWRTSLKLSWFREKLFSSSFYSSSIAKDIIKEKKKRKKEKWPRDDRSRKDNRGR